jgi:hypothetical protein
LPLIPAVRPFIEKANQSGVWYNEDLIRKVLREVGE